MIGPGLLSSKSLVNNKENIQSLGNLKRQGKEARGFAGKEVQNLKAPAPRPGKMEIEEPVCMDQGRAAAPDPQHVVDFQGSILHFLQSRQASYAVDSGYLSRQRDINAKMRSILIDWLVDVNIKFKLLPQTLFMTVNVIDRYLALEPVTRQTLQLVGVTALMIVSKYEEIYPPLIKDYIAVCDNAYSKEDLLSMEARVLLALRFDLTQTSSLTFLEHLQLAICLEPKALVFARYILENALFDLLALQYSNLELAAGSIFLVNKIFKKEGWKGNFEEATGVGEGTAKACAKELYQVMQKVDASSLTALKRKFAAPELYEVSKYRIEKVQSANSN